MKDLIFIDTSLNDLRDFPDTARHEAGYQLDSVQRGMEPSDWKPMKSVGSGVKEIRIHEDGEHRVLYVVKFDETVYVLHAFQKKSQKTPKKDIALGKKRYQVLVNERKK